MNPRPPARFRNGASKDFVNKRGNVSFAKKDEPEKIANRVSLRPLEVAVRNLAGDIFQMH
jgi:hypothetical protein